MEIKNLDGITIEQLQLEIQNGGKFVIFEYCVSILIMTFKRPTDIYFLRADESALNKHIGYTILSLFLGWWGIPWGIIYTPMAIISNLSGGKDVTQEVLQSILSQHTIDPQINIPTE